MKRIKKEDYISSEVLHLEQQLKELTKRDKEYAVVMNILNKISDERQQIILDILSRKFATKNEYPDYSGISTTLNNETLKTLVIEGE